MTDYTDFDGAQARVTNDVLYITWARLGNEPPHLTITHVQHVVHVQWTKGFGGIVLHLPNYRYNIACKKSRELAEFIGKHMEGYYAEEWEQFFPGHGAKADA